MLWSSVVLNHRCSNAVCWGGEGKGRGCDFVVRWLVLGVGRLSSRSARAARTTRRMQSTSEWSAAALRRRLPAKSTDMLPLPRTDAA